MLPIERRCACPLHQGDNRGRTVSVNLAENVFHGLDTRCGQQGDVIDLWAALHQLDPRTPRSKGSAPLARSGTVNRRKTVRHHLDGP